jgi:hypothetical protein
METLFARRAERALHVVEEQIETWAPMIIFAVFILACVVFGRLWSTLMYDAINAPAVRVSAPDLLGHVEDRRPRLNDGAKHDRLDVVSGP